MGSEIELLISIGAKDFKTKKETMATGKVPYNDLLKSTNETITYDKLLSTLEWHEKRLSIIERDNGKCQCCNKGTDLHVHHKEYILGCLPWEYDSDVFQTLCSNCHNSIHSDPEINIPIYKIENGRKILFNGTPCKRCNGLGRIPEYKKVQNGICFRCRGKKFEELLVYKTTSLKK